MSLTSVVAQGIDSDTLNAPKIGIRAGVGTDVAGGLAFGAGANYLVSLPQNSIELGVILFGGSFDESTDIGIHTYNETTDMFAFGLFANYLFGYTPNQPSTFFIAGLGLASVSINWEERSATDGTLGTQLPGGGSMQTDDGTTGGSIVNLGIGHTFAGGVDIRAELPVIFVYSVPGEASTVAPTLIVTAGLRF